MPCQNSQNYQICTFHSCHLVTKFKQNSKATKTLFKQNVTYCIVNVYKILDLSNTANIIEFYTGNPGIRVPARLITTRFRKYYPVPT